MIQSAAPAVRIILYEGTGSLPMTAAHRLEMFRELLQKGYQVTRAIKDGVVSTFKEGTLIVLGQFNGGSAPQLRTDDPNVTIYVREVGSQSPSQIVGVVEGLMESAEITIATIPGTISRIKPNPIASR